MKGRSSKSLLDKSQGACGPRAGRARTASGSRGSGDRPPAKMLAEDRILDPLGGILLHRLQHVRVDVEGHLRAGAGGAPAFRPSAA